MTAAPVRLVDALDLRLADDADALCDDRRAVLREYVDDVLGPQLAGRATCDVDDLAHVFPKLGRSSRYELARRLPGVQVGRRRLVSVVGVVASLLGVETDGGP